MGTLAGFRDCTLCLTCSTVVDGWQNEIIEIGALKYTEGKPDVDTFHVLVKPRGRIPKGGTAVHGMTNAMLKKYESIEVELPQFIDFIGDLPLVIHNASFDMGFLIQNAKRIGLEVKNPVIDTLTLARKAYPTMDNHKLATLKKKLKIPMKGSHRALDDCLTTFYLYRKTIEVLFNTEKVGYASLFCVA